MLEQPNLRPIIDPLLNLLRSRKFLVAVFTLVIDVLVAYLPALEPARAELLVTFTLIGSLLVGAIAYEDGKKNGNGS